MGAALGPVFSSCAPTYGLLIATILPLDITSGLIGLTFYFIGLGSILLLITIFGRSILGKFRFFANPS
jgi:cytochrome c biogenesis protein CcdA